MPIKIHFVTLFGGGEPTNPPSIDQILPGIYDSVNAAIRVEAESGGAGNPSPSNADQVMGAIYDRANGAIRIECLSGCGGGLAPSWTLNSTTNTVLAQPASGQDAVPLQVEPSVSSPAADIFQAYLPGATPSATCSTNSKCAFAVQANGNMYTLGNNFTLGSPNQATASYLFLYGGTPGQSYIELSSAALNPPVAPTLSTSTTGGALPANTPYPIELTYVNGAGETTIGPSTSITTGAGSTNKIVVTSPAGETNAATYNVYARASGGNWYLQNSSPVPIGTNLTMTSMNTSSNAPPAGNTTGSLYNSVLSMSAEGNAVLCSSSSAPGQDCVPGTTLVMQAAGTPVTGDCVNWTGPNQIGDAGAACGSGAGPSWSALTAPTASLSLAMSSNSTTFTWTGGNEMNWTAGGNVLWQNTTAATSTANQNSPTLTLEGTVWNNTTSVNDQWNIQDQIASGSNGQSVLSIAHSGSTANNSAINANVGFDSSTPNTYGGANFYVNQAAGSGNDFLEFWRNGTEYMRFSSVGSLILQGGGGAHIDQNGGNGDIDGTITVTTTETSASAGFISHYGSAPACVITPESNPGSLTWWVTTSVSAVTANLSAAPTASIMFNYICMGNPN